MSSSGLGAAPRAGLVGAGIGVLAAGAAVGSVLGSAVERRLMRSSLDDAQEHGYGYGTVHSAPTVVASEDGVQLYVEVDEAPVGGGPYPGLTVVFSHGFALNLDVWHPQRLAMREAGIRAVFWDQRGHGRSGRGEPGTASIDRLGHDLDAVVEATVPHAERVVLVGHSMGGMTVMALADERPELFGTHVVGVALLSTSSGKMAEVSLGLPAAAAGFFRRAAPGVVGVLGRSPRLVELGRKTGSDLEYALTRMYSFSSQVPPSAVDFVRQMNSATPVDVVAELFPAIDAHDKLDALVVLQGVATLVLVGSDDRLTPAEHSQVIVSEIPGAELVLVEGCGHMVTLEQPDLVNAALLDLVTRADLAHPAAGSAARA